MHFAYAAYYDPRNMHRGSGTPAYMIRALERQGHRVTGVNLQDVTAPVLTRFFKRLSAWSGKQYSSYRDPFLTGAAGRVLRKRLRGLEFDYLLTNDYGIAGYANIPQPVILYTDDSFPHNYGENIHPWKAGLSWWGIKFSQYTTRQGLKNSRACFFAAAAAYQEALKYKTGTPLAVIPYGANLEDPGPDTAARRRWASILAKRRLDVLFVGTDWGLKGGEEAVAVVERLQQKGLFAFLHIVGAEPPGTKGLPWIELHGKLDKSQPEQLRLLCTLYEQADVFLLPSKVEGYGLVFVEAAAYGLPSLAYRTEGVATAVKDGQSGLLLERSPQAVEQFVQIITGWYQHPAQYEQLCKGARRHYEENGNWDTAIKRLEGALQSMNTL